MAVCLTRLSFLSVCVVARSWSTYLQRIHDIHGRRRSAYYPSRCIDFNYSALYPRSTLSLSFPLSTCKSSRPFASCVLFLFGASHRKGLKLKTHPFVFDSFLEQTCFKQPNLLLLPKASQIHPHSVHKLLNYIKPHSKSMHGMIVMIIILFVTLPPCY